MNYYDDDPNEAGWLIPSWWHTWAKPENGMLGGGQVLGFIGQDPDGHHVRMRAEIPKPVRADELWWIVEDAFHARGVTVFAPEYREAL